MKRIIATGAVAALAAVGFAGTSVAAPGGTPGAGQKPVEGGIACQQFGIGVLQATGALPAVAKNGLEYPINSGTVYSFSEVLAIHRTAPALANAVLKAYAPVLLPDASPAELAAVAAAVDEACPA
jgi:hypothetical protein